MLESIQMDLVGETHIDFGDESLVYVQAGYARLQLPGRIKGREVAINIPLAYQNIGWVGKVVRRQWWLLFPGVLFGFLGLVWTIQGIGNWGPFAVGVVFFLGLGIFPLVFLAKGRPYLGIATEDRIIILPMDRQKQRIRRILGLLKQACPSSDITWALSETAFNNPRAWDNRPPTGKEFDRNQYLQISAAISLYGFASLLRRNPALHTLAVTLLVLAAAMVFQIVARPIVRRLWKKSG